MFVSLVFFYILLPDHSSLFSTEPPVMIVDPKDDIHLDRYLSEEIVLNCELSRSSGVARWFKDGLEVRESENVRVSSEGPYRRLTILCGLKEDSGEYVCDTGGDSVFFQLSVTGTRHHQQQGYYIYIYTVGKISI